MDVGRYTYPKESEGILVRYLDHSTLGGDEQTRTLGHFEDLRSRPIHVKRIQFMPGDLPG